MKSTLLSIALVVMAGVCFSLALSSCTSGNLGSSSSQVAGVGDVCTQDSDCNAGLECEHGTCQVDEDENEPAPPPGAVACQVDTDCAAGEECDDGFCKADEVPPPPGAVACLVDTDCAAGQECDDGFCKADEVPPPPGAVACLVDADCAVGEECDDGFCKPHDGSDDGSGHH